MAACVISHPRRRHASRRHESRRHATAAGHVFLGFDEPDIDFRPTYKMDRGT